MLVFTKLEDTQSTITRVLVRHQVLTVLRMKMTVFWDVALCSLVEVYQRFRGACCLHHRGDQP
jgi:hypothetical protein